MPLELSPMPQWMELVLGCSHFTKWELRLRERGRFVHTCGSPWVKKINMMPCLYYIGEMRAMKVIYNKNMCFTM